MTETSPAEPEVIIPNLNRRFSGITSTILQVVPHQRRVLRMATVGYPLACDLPRLGWSELIRATRRAPSNRASVVFHARRNIEMLAGLVLKRLLGCRLHLVFTSTAQRRLSAWTHFLSGQMDTLVSTSPRAASFMRRPPEAIIPHGVNVAAYQPAPDRRQAWREGGLPGERGIGIFGRVRPQKGSRDFVEALCEVLPHHPGWTAVIIGQITPNHQAFARELKHHIRACGLEERFCWLGQVPFEEIPRWFRRMSLVVCASHNEGFGLTCLEAMASGVPVVATRAGAWDVIVREGVEGYLAEPANRASLAAAIARALREGNLEAMGLAARQRVLAEYTSEKEAAALVALYRRCLGAAV